MDEILPKNSEARYRSSVRVGNWNEELFLEETRVREFLTKREQGKLLVQQTRRVFSHLLKEVEIEPPCHSIRFGANIQLIATDIPNFNGQPMAISLVIDARSIDLCNKISDKSDVSLAPSYKPCVRNVFIIKSADSIDRTNEILKYGQDFYLQCVEAEKQPLVLYSSPKTHAVSNVGNCPYSYTSNTGEINQSIGVCLQQSHGCTFVDCEPPVPSSHCRWKCININPTIRIETEGAEVPSNARLVIVHSATNLNLAAEPIKSHTFFGPECGVSVHTYYDMRRCETSLNIWMIAVTPSKDVY